jgi:hypothetical protein
LFIGWTETPNWVARADLPVLPDCGAWAGSRGSIIAALAAITIPIPLIEYLIPITSFKLIWCEVRFRVAENVPFPEAF